MKKIVFFALAMLFQISHLQAGESEWLEKKIQQGNWNISGGGSVAYDTFNGLNGTATASAQYFFWQHFSLGLQASYYHLKYSDGYGLGPKGTYYFYETEKKAFYFSQNITFNWNSTDSVAGIAGVNKSLVSAQSSLGFEHFFTPNVSFGPELRYLYYLEKDGVSSLRNDVGILLNFSLFF